MKRAFRFLLIINIMACTTIGMADYKDAVSLFEEKKYQESLSQCAKDLNVANDYTADSPNYNIRFLAAHNHWHLGNTQSAIDHFSKCMVIKKEAIEPYVDLALLYLDKKRYEDADRTARKGLTIAKSPLLYFAIGMSSYKRGNFWRAKEMFEKANSEKPDFIISYNALGIVLMRLKKYSQANTAFSVALAIKPDSSVIMNNMGLSLEKQGKYKEAYAYYKNANKLNDENKTILENLVRIKKKIE